MARGERGRRALPAETLLVAKLATPKAEKDAAATLRALEGARSVDGTALAPPILLGVLRRTAQVLAYGCRAACKGCSVDGRQAHVEQRGSRVLHTRSGSGRIVSSHGNSNVVCIWADHCVSCIIRARPATSPTSAEALLVAQLAA